MSLINQFLNYSQYFQTFLNLIGITVQTLILLVGLVYVECRLL